MKLKSIHRPVILCVVLLLSCFSIQCYTTLRHPSVVLQQEGSEGYHSSEITFMDDCSACHEQSSAITEPYSEIYYDSVYDQDYEWQYFFDLPWWIDEYYYESYPADLGSPVRPPERRPFEKGEIGTTPMHVTPSTSRPALSKTPSSDSNSSQPTQRHGRREAMTNKNKESAKSTTPAPTREKKDKKTKKKKS